MALPEHGLSVLSGIFNPRRRLSREAVRLSVTAMSCIILVVSGHAAAATLEVDGADTSCSDVTGGPYCTIQAAIDAASASDTVLVMPGTYGENLNFKGKAITVRSYQGPSETIVDGGAADTVAFFGNGETRDTVLEGFTLRNGYAKHGGGVTSSGSGGGIRIEQTSPTIRNNVITHNVSDMPGFGIDIYRGAPMIDGNTISNNSPSGDSSGGGGGAGIHISTGVVDGTQIINNTIINNDVENAYSGSGGIEMGGTGITVRNNHISGNRGGSGGGIWVGGTDHLIVQNVIINNTASDEGGGIYVWGPTGLKVINNTIAFNDCTGGSGVFADAGDVAAELRNNIIIAYTDQTAVLCGDFNNPTLPVFDSNNVYSASGQSYDGNCTDQTGVNGNISVPPQFVDTGSDDYRVDPGSQVIDAGNSSDPDLPSTDYAGKPRIAETSVDIGAYEFSPNPGYLEFTVDSLVLRENEVSATLTVERKAGKTGLVTARCSTGDNTALADLDYTPVSDTVIFADGDAEDKSITVTIVNDDTSESYETFRVYLSNPTGGATLGSANSIDLSIMDDDGSTGLFSYIEEESGGCFIMTADRGGLFF